MELTSTGNSTSSGNSIKREKNHLFHVNKNNLYMASSNSSSNKRPPDPEPGGGSGDGSGSDGQGDGVGLESLGPPPAKTQKIVFEPVRLVGVSNQEEMDIKVLRFQQKKLREVINLKLLFC